MAKAVKLPFYAAWGDRFMFIAGAV